MIQRHTIACGCEITVYGDGSAPPEITYCDIHDAAPDLLSALKRIATIDHHRKPTLTWRDLSIESMDIAKGAIARAKERE